MMENQVKLQPEGVFHYFAEICKIPRPSKKEEKIMTYLNVEPQYEDDELSNISSVAPSLVGKSVGDAKVSAAKFTVR